MFGLRRRERPPLELYGKLPIAKDYLRLGFGDGAGLMLRDWLDATYSTSADPEDRPSVAWPARFVLGDAWGGGSIVGLLSPSTDAGGLRPFPFAIGVERRRKALIEDVETGFDHVSEAVWRELRSQQDCCAAQADGRSGLAKLRGVELDVEGLGVCPSRGVSLEPWFDAIWPDRGREGFVATLERVGRGAARRRAASPAVGGRPAAARPGAGLVVGALFRRTRRRPCLSDAGVPGVVRVDT